MRATNGISHAKVARAFIPLVVASILAVVLVVALALVDVHRLARADALHHAEREARLAQSIVAPAVTAGVLAGDPGALEHLDEVVRADVLRDPIVRIKIWDADNRVVYSDEPRLIGARFPFDAEDRAVLAGAVKTGLSDLDEPENLFERDYDQLLEVYRGFAGPAGEHLRFEVYQRYDPAAAGPPVSLGLMPTLLAGLLILQLICLGVCRSFTLRMVRGAEERLMLSQRALEAGEEERRRIAGELHDGIVQDITAVSYAVAGASRRLQGVAEPETVDALERSAETARRSVQALRGLLSDEYPVDVIVAGLPAALDALAAEAEERGVPVELDVELDAVEPEPARLLFRAAREGVRNAVSHAEPRSVRVRARTGAGRAWIEVTDDGRGFEPGRPQENGHLGLRALEEVLTRAGGDLEIVSAPGRGTTLRAEVAAT